MSEEKNIKKSESEEQKGSPTLVTPLSTIATQVGEHVLSAIHNDEETVAVITTVTGSKTGPQVISIPLNAEHLQQVNVLMNEIHASDEPERVPCVGFHCYVESGDEKENS